MKKVYIAGLLMFGSMVITYATDDMKTFDAYIENFNIQEVGNMKISAVEMLNMIEENKAILVDIRFEQEVDAWRIPFAKHIPINELPKRLHELPKDKLIITACPHNDRANIARLYLAMKGYKVKYVNDGLLKVVDYLKGANAFEFANELNKTGK